MYIFNYNFKKLQLYNKNDNILTFWKILLLIILGLEFIIFEIVSIFYCISVLLNVLSGKNDSKELLEYYEDKKNNKNNNENNENNIDNVRIIANSERVNIN